MKKIFFFAAIFFAATCYAAGPNEEVLKAFKKTFQNVTDVNWTDVENNFEASFSNNNISYRVLYNKQGEVVKSMRYYGGQVLPVFIQARLHRKYDGKTVFGVTEVTTESQVNYYIILEDDSTWTHVQSDAYGNLFTEKSLKKV